VLPWEKSYDQLSLDERIKLAQLQARLLSRSGKLLQSGSLAIERLLVS